MRISDWSSDVCSSDLFHRLIAAAFYPPAIERAVMPHHHRRRIVEPLDQQAGFVPDRNRQRAERARHALPAQPILGGGAQRAGAILLLGLEQPPIAGAGPHAPFGGLREREFAARRRDAAERADRKSA